MNTRTYITGVLALLVVTGTGLAASADLNNEITRSQLMAASCQACHNAAGAEHGMTNLSLLEEEMIARQMRAFRDGQRDATIMNRHAKGYSDEEIDALAAYFGNE